MNAQGEDVVAGIRNTEAHRGLASKLAGPRGRPASSSSGIFVILEEHYRDMMDIEFTIEQGKLWMLQTRVGKRTATAALAIAMRAGGARASSPSEEARACASTPAQLDQLHAPAVRPKSAELQRPRPAA